MPISVDCVIVTTAGFARCTSSKPQACVSTAAGVSLPSGVGTVHNLRPASASGAPPSSVCTWARSVQITPARPRVSAASATTLAPVPLNIGNASARGPNSRRTASPSAAVTSSPP